VVEECKHFVECGNNFRMCVDGKGNARLVINDTTFLCQNVCHVYEPQNNLWVSH